MTASPQPSPSRLAVTFLAPPVMPSTETAESWPEHNSETQVDWLPKAKAAAGAMGITQEQVAQVISDPDEARADARDPRCTVFRRGNLTVVTGKEGRVIAVRRGKHA